MITEHKYTCSCGHALQVSQLRYGPQRLWVGLRTHCTECGSTVTSWFSDASGNGYGIG